MQRSAWYLIPIVALLALGVLVAASFKAPSRAAAVTTPAGQPRLAVLSPAIAVILDDLGCGDRIVGRHAFDIVLPSEVPVVGDMNGIDYERLLRLNPTDILIEDNQQGPPDRLTLLAEEHGWTIHAYPMLALDDIPATTKRLAQAFGGDEGIAEAEAWTQRSDALFREPNASTSSAGAVLPLYWTNPPGAAGPGSFHAEILQSLGFDLAIEEGGPYITIDPEDILRMDPDSILLLMPGADPDRVDELLGPLLQLDLRCVREGRVAVIHHELVNLPATSILDVVREILDATAAWAPPAATAAE